jgi:MFS family permease
VGPWTDTFRALKHRDFRLYIAGMAVSLAGTWMQQLAVSWLVFRLTQSEWMLGLTGFCANIPVLLLSPLAGVVADRYPRRRIVMVAQSIAMLQAAALAALTYAGLIRVPHVLGLALLLGIVSAFDIPARQALFVRLVGREDLLNAISLNSATFNTARIVGPSLGGFLVARMGEGACFLLNTVSFVAVLASLAAMRPVEEAGGTAEAPLERLRSGMRYAWRSLPLRTLLGAAGTLALSVAPVLSLAPVFAGGIFGRGSQGLGWLTGGMGLGAVLGTLSLARQKDVTRMPTVMRQAGFLLGGALLLFSVSPSYWLCLALMPVVGMNLMRQNAAANTAVQTRVAEQYRGRVMGIYSMMVIGMLPVGSLAAGALASWAGERMAVPGARVAVACGGLLSLAGAWRIASRMAMIRSWLEGREEHAG